MKKVALILAAAAVLATTQAQAISRLSDSAGDTKFSHSEIQGVFPGVSQRSFIAADINGDGYLSMNELMAAQERGLVPGGSNSYDAGKH